MSLLSILFSVLSNGERSDFLFFTGSMLNNNPGNRFISRSTKAIEAISSFLYTGMPIFRQTAEIFFAPKYWLLRFV